MCESLVILAEQDTMSNAVVTGVTPVESENTLTDAKQVCELIWRLIDGSRWCRGSLSVLVRVL